MTAETRPAPGPSGTPTAATLAYLREARSASRRQSRRNTASAVYGIALVAAGWGVPVLVAAAGRIPRRGTLAEHLWTPAAVALLLLALLLMARAAMWRGPVVVDRATVSWLLSTPVDRAPVLRSRLWASAIRAGSAGLVLGGASGFLLPGPTPLLTAAGAWAGASVALTGTALGALVERYGSWTTRHARTVFGTGWALFAVCLTGTVCSALGAGTEWIGHVLLWSGPWGWAAQPLIAATGGQVAGWGVAAVLSTATSLAALAFSLRELPHIPLSALRLRATVAAQLTASLFMLDLRQARSDVPALRERGVRPALRLPMPRRRRLLVPWRDATALLRAPGRLGWAVVWAVAAVGLTVVAPTLGPTAQPVAAVSALVAAYLAAAQLAEPARLESDDVRRSANLPYPAKTLATWHSLVPAVLLTGALGVGAAACAVSGRGVPGLAPLVASAPVLVMAALVSSYRGVMPAHVLVGAETPMGNTGPFQAALWYLRGPLAALALIAPVSAHGGPYGVPQLLWHVLLGAAGLWWARRTAHRLHTG